MHSNAHDGVMIMYVLPNARLLCQRCGTSSDEVMAATASFVSGADVLCDAQYLPGADYRRTSWLGIITRRWHETARKAGVGQLLLIHHEPGATMPP